MKPSIKALLSAAIVAAAYALLWPLWVKSQLLSALLAVVAAAAWGLTWVQRGGAGIGPSGEPGGEPRAGAERGAATSLAGWGLQALGLLSLSAAFLLALEAKMAWAGLLVVAAALCWRPYVRLHQEELPARTAWALLGATLLLGAFFRLYKIGQIPVGLITVDEPRLLPVAHDIVDGVRQSFAVGGTIADGVLPFYLQALTMQLFGDGVTGFRLAGALSGIATIALMFMLALELGGRRLAVAVAAFTAFAFWPLTFSRAEYLMAETYLPVLSCFWLLLHGARTGRAASFVGAGLAFGLCFNVYKSGQLAAVLLPLLTGLLWLRQPGQRAALKGGVAPFLAAALLSLSPLLLWTAQDPKVAYGTYFSSLYGQHTAGAGLEQADSFLGKVDIALGRVLPELSKVMTMFTTKGPMRHWYFLAERPMISQPMLFLFLAGLAVSLLRFRLAAYAFMPLWWFIGLTPALVSNPMLNMDERRAMLSMPPTLLLAAVGLLALLDLGTRSLGRRLRWAVSGALLLGFFGYFAGRTWVDYFQVMNRNKDFLEFNHANYASYARAVWEENAKSPVYVVTTRRANNDAWNDPNLHPERIEYASVNWRLPTYYAQTDSEYYSRGGLFYAMGQAASAPAAPGGKPRQDVLVVLTPFHFYLEPLLVKELGGKLVRELPLVQSSSGPSFQDIGMAYDPSLGSKLIRVPPLDSVRLEALKQRYAYPFTVEELTPPARLQPPPPPGDREALIRAWAYSKENVAWLRDYEQRPERWKAGKRADFSLPDAYFWNTANNFPQGVRIPLRLRAAWVLSVPEDGEYMLGASSTVFATLRLDGKPAFRFLPESGTVHDEARAGMLGPALKLRAGLHRLEIEQVMLGQEGNYNHLLRLVWKRPGKDKETLPLEFLYPDEKTAKAGAARQGS